MAQINTSLAVIGSNATATVSNGAVAWDYYNYGTNPSWSGTEVETYVAQNHHLPDIQPAEEMKKEGLDVGDNQTKLLQKVEELTLYLIKQDKQLQQQAQQLQQQAQLLQAQQEKINRLEKMEKNVKE